MRAVVLWGLLLILGLSRPASAATKLTIKPICRTASVTVPVPVNPTILVPGQSTFRVVDAGGTPLPYRVLNDVVPNDAVHADRYAVRVAVEAADGTLIQLQTYSRTQKKWCSHGSNQYAATARYVRDDTIALGQARRVERQAGSSTHQCIDLDVVKPPQATRFRLEAATTHDRLATASAYMTVRGDGHSNTIAICPHDLGGAFFVRLTAIYVDGSEGVARTFHVEDLASAPRLPASGNWIRGVLLGVTLEGSSKQPAPLYTIRSP